MTWPFSKKLPCNHQWVADILCRNRTIEETRYAWKTREGQWFTCVYCGKRDFRPKDGGEEEWHIRWQYEG